MKTIEEVLLRLNAVIEWSKANESPLGFFPVVYYRMTESVRQGIADKIFENNPRMEQLDVVFAQRYLDAFEAWQAGQPTSQAWAAAFNAAQSDKTTVLQHVLLGINAHINLDLGIAAAQVSEGGDIEALRPDFDRINQVIASLVDETQQELARVFPPFGWLDRLLQRQDERLTQGIIRSGRQFAWTAARALSALHGAPQQAFIEQLDTTVSLFAKAVYNPGNWFQRLQRWMRQGETGSVREKIERLQAP